ncbi:chaperone NapD [Vibrio sp.]|nr:chaperone NapD [Vibrio sp.]
MSVKIQQPDSNTNETHISSVIVHVNPSSLFEIKERINAIPHTEVYGTSPEGKMVVVLETVSEKKVTEQIEDICNIPDVLSCVLVYHQIEDDLYTEL